MRRLSPDFTRARSATDKLNNLIVTCASPDPQYDFYSRCFCPWIGINEDPVTGAAHCVLAPYWAVKLGKSSMNAYQASARGGSMHLRIHGEKKVIIKSQAMVVLEGIMRV